MTDTARPFGPSPDRAGSANRAAPLPATAPRSVPPGALSARKGQLRWLSGAALVLGGLIALPILGILASLLAPVFGVSSGPDGAWPHVRDTLLGEMALNSLLLALGTGTGVTVIGVGTAWLVTMCAFPGRRLFEWALVLPLAVPAYVLAYMYTDFLHHPGAVQTALRAVTGWGPRDYWFPEIRSREGAILIFSAAFYPYVYLLTRAAFLHQSVSILEASRSLGATPWASFTRVALPMARPAIVAGLALALMETLADFGAVAHFGVPTLTTGIDRVWVSMGDRLLAVQLSAALLSVMILLLVLERRNRGKARYDDTRGRYTTLSRYRLSPLAQAGAFTACALPVAIGFVIPLCLLISLNATAGHDLFAPRYLTLTWNTMTLAGLSAVITTGVALILAYARRLQGGPIGTWTGRLAGLGYALPGTVIAVGILWPLATFDNAIDAAFRDLFGVSTGLVLTGSIAALLYAYTVRFLTIPLQSVEAGLTQITPNMEAAARTLGARPGETLRRVHVPILSTGLLTAAMITFVEVMKELPATKILRPFDFDTLATQAYRFASDERLAEASTACLVIVAAGIGPVIILSRTIARSRPGATII